MASQAERREATRSALVAAARSCFLELGYEATSTEAVLARAGVSKGALYHHFASKADLMAAVFEAVSRETAAKAGAGAATEDDPRQALTRALKLWLRAALEPEPRRVILETGPAVLGLARARQIEEAVTQTPVRRLIERAVERGQARCEDPDLAARLLCVAVGELALTAAQRGVEEKTLARLDPALDALVEALVPTG